jgi:FMN phosphatase YigB (HAD superfamily)
VSKVILTDCDEVLFDWAGPFEDWVRANYPEHRDAEGSLRDHWHVEAWLNCPLEHSREMIRIFNGDDTIWPYFKPLDGAVEVVKKLHEEHGFRFVAITACATDEKTHSGRWQNLTDHFAGAFDTLHCVGLAESKAAHLGRYRDTYWVEDKMKHAVAGADAGHRSFLVNYKHNERDFDHRITRVNDWHDIYKHIRADEETALTLG